MVAEELVLMVKAETAKATADIQKFQNSTKTTQDKIVDFAKAAAISFLSVQAATAALTAAFDAAKYAAGFKQINNAFDSMAERAGADSNRITASLRQMSAGTISDLNLVRSAAKANLLGIPVDKMDKLMQIARASAAATGESVQKMFDDIVTGIGRSSPMILDNLGITVKIEAANQKYAASIGKTAEELTDADKKQAMLNAVLESGATIMGKVGEAATKITAVEQWQRLQTNVENLRKETGLALLPAYEKIVEASANFVGKLAEAARITNVLKNVGTEAYSTGEKIKAVSSEIERLNTGALTSGIGGDVSAWRRVEALKAQKDALEELSRWEQKQKRAEADKNAAAAKAAAEEMRRAAERAALAEELAALYAKTDQGQVEAVQAQIAYWEKQAAANKNLRAQIQPVLDQLYEELRVKKELIDLKLPEMGGMSPSGAEGMKYLGVTFKEVAKEAEKLFEVWVPLNDGAMTGNIMRLNAALEITRDKLQKIREYDALAKLANDAENFTGPITDATEKIQSFSEIMEELAPQLGEMWGGAIVEMIKGTGSLKDVVKQTFASILRAYGSTLAFTGNFVGAALAYAGAGAIMALAKGGIVTKPTQALIGEKGPEAVIPLNRAAPSLGSTINLTVNGSILSEGELINALAGAMSRRGRGY